MTADDIARLGTLRVRPLVRATLSEQQLVHALARHLAKLITLPNQRVCSQFSAEPQHGKPVRVWVVTEQEPVLETIVSTAVDSPYRASDLEEISEPSFYAPVPSL